MSVRIYSTSTCPWCDKAKDYLKKLGVAFEAVDVSKDRAMAEEMIRKTGQRGVPVLDIGGKVIVGFDQPAIDAALKEQNLLS